MRKVRRVCVVTGTRAEFGLLAPVMNEIRDAGLELLTVVAGMHLASQFGDTRKHVEAAGFKVAGSVPMTPSSDDNIAMARSIGQGILGFTDVFEALDPDVVLVLGDRVEAFAAATAAATMLKLVAHVHGGERTRGGLDESYRHAITKLAHIHFVATKGSRRRVIRMGERVATVHLVGAPGLDVAKGIGKPSSVDLEAELGGPLPDKFVLVSQHPVSTGADQAAQQMRETLAAVAAVGLPAIVLYPNADPGGRRMIEVAKEEARNGRIRLVPSLTHKAYLQVLRRCGVLVGNTSSGIIEAPAFGTPFVHVGTRQAGRERGRNVIDVPHDRQKIRRALERALRNKEFRRRAANTANPYGDGTASKRIAKILKGLDVSEALLQKEIAF